MQNSKPAQTAAPCQQPRQFLVRLQNLAHRMHTNSFGSLLARTIELAIRIICSAHLPPAAKISPSTHFSHNGLGVIIHPLSEIGANCIIGPHVVLGGRAPLHGAPILSENVTVHAGAKLIGDIHIGDGCVIGANAVVTKNLPSNCVAVGIPAEIIKTDIDPAKYR